ncbi:MAG TPA: response regulator [Oculatellaceae cyanobacterium]
MNITNVLLVDDDPAIRMVAEICLAKVGNWNVSLADCGPKGLEIALREKPDLILLDVMMPGMDGPTMLGLLRQQLDTPVIFVTAKVQPSEVDRYLKLGAVGVIAKPFDPMELPTIICNIIKGEKTSVIYDGATVTSIEREALDRTLVPLAG